MKNQSDINDFSSMSKVFRITAWIRRFINNMKLKKTNRIKTLLMAEEIEEAEEIWIKEIMAPLLSDRIEQSPPFAVTGLDFAGPIHIKISKEKFYILLCTCAVTRALHFELVTSLTTEAFFLVFRRFISRLGLYLYAPSKVAKSPVPVTNYAPFRQWPIKSNDRDSFSEDASAQREEIHRSIDENDQTKYLVIDSINMQGYTLVNDRLELSNLEDWLENLPFENIDCFK
ncbi:uncharacterized protein TNIN_268911 [Trichonephila inaurata madagascariensis]|uniref:Uncharacterized protein n=1 Tax=Trichonephila inaurata madagascariensis TaxID=2747483 RepID=A0A8X7BQ91_9ARAC|nr:uncharacterized protein TNIN_268911 [Trichonephila inaurata madagascariensis]